MVFPLLSMRQLSVSTEQYIKFPTGMSISGDANQAAKAQPDHKGADEIPSGKPVSRTAPPAPVRPARFTAMKVVTYFDTKCTPY